MPLRRAWEATAMQIGESTWLRLPAHLQALFRKLPNYGSEEVVACFPESGPAKATDRGQGWSSDGSNGGWQREAHSNYASAVRGIDDAGGSAARFFYTSKADADDRLGSRHPTVKPLDL